MPTNTGLTLYFSAANSLQCVQIIIIIIIILLLRSAFAIRSIQRVCREILQGYALLRGKLWPTYLSTRCMYISEIPFRRAIPVSPGSACSLVGIG
jgi:hypothetical protein